MRRSVVTGTGTVNPLGNNTEDTWQAMLAGKSGIDTITAIDVSNYDTKIGGEVKNFPEQVDEYTSNNNTSKVGKMDKFVQYAMKATKEAVEMAGFYSFDKPERVGVSIGSGIGGMNCQQKNAKSWINRGHRRINPFYIPGLIGNIAAGFVSIEYGITGPNLSLQTACATSNHAISTAMMIIQNNMADVMIAGGSEAAITEMGLAGFCNMKALSTKFNDTPEKASRPFDADRDGFVMAEGAGILIIEDYEHAKARGANILCELASFGMSGDAFDLVMPHKEGTGALQSMQMACDYAGIKTTDISYINAHGTSTPFGDIAEAKAIFRLIGGDERNLHVGSTKSMHGHMLGATSGVEAIACIMGIREGKLPPNINLDNKDEKVAINCLNTEVIEKDVRIALSNSFGFGGHNSTLCFRKL